MVQPPGGAGRRGVARLPLLEHPVEGDLANLGPHRRLRELGHGKVGVLDAVRGAVGVRHLDEQDAVDGHAHVVAGDGGLARNRDGLLLERKDVRHALHQRNQEAEARLQHLVVPPECLHHPGHLLRHDDDALRRREGRRPSATRTLC